MTNKTLRMKLRILADEETEKRILLLDSRCAERSELEQIFIEASCKIARVITGSPPYKFCLGSTQYDAELSLNVEKIDFDAPRSILTAQEITRTRERFYRLIQRWKAEKNAEDRRANKEELIRRLK